MGYVLSYCHISNNSCFINGKEVLTHTGENDFVKELYLSLGFKYPKFHKMDELSKLAFLGCELLIKSNPEIASYGENDIAMLFANKTSSAVTDLKFIDSYKDNGLPSPGLFVYTLPNILMGEISIKNKWYGESMFTVQPEFDAEYFTNYSNILLNKNSEAALCGWVNVTPQKNESFFFFVTKKDLKQVNSQLSSEKLAELFRTIKFD
jgi:hypothetical protein